MKRFKTLLFVLIMVFSAEMPTIAQEVVNEKDVISIDNKLKQIDLMTKQLESDISDLLGSNSSILKTRSNNQEFYDAVLLISTPTEVSFPLMDYTKVTNGVQRKPYIINAIVQTPIALGGKRWGNSNLMGSFHFVPKFKIRIFENDKSPQVGDSSLPVRTPSYMPGGTLYLATHRMSLWKKGWFAGISFFHHSNGQDQPEFNENGSLNTRTGNFSDNFFQFSINRYRSNKIGSFTYKDPLMFAYKWLKGPFRNLFYTNKAKSFINQDDLDNSVTSYYKLVYEWHPKPLTNSEMWSRGLYGRKRINIQIGSIFSPTYVEYILDNQNDKYVQVTRPIKKEMYRHLLEATYIMDGVYNLGGESNQQSVNFFNVSRRLNASYSIHFRAPGTQYASFFVNFGYYGSDPYNIYFQQSMWYGRIGLGFGFFEFDKTRDLK